MPQATGTGASASSSGERGPVRLVIFDFDGALADTYDWFAGVINGVADRFGFRRVEAEEAERFRGLDAREIIRELGIPAWKLPRIARHMHALAAEEIASVQLFPGVPRMLAELESGGLALAIVSSNAEANVRAVLGAEAARIAHFDCGASLFGKGRRLRAVMASLGAPAGAVLAIGDEIRDLDAACEAGCAFAAVGWGYTTPEALRARRPDRIFAAPREIAPALLRGGARLLADQMPEREPGASDPPPEPKGS